MAVIAIAKLTAPKRFTDFTFVVINSKYLNIYARDQKFFDKFDALLFGNLILSASVFSYIVYKHTYNITDVSINLMFKIAVGISVFILIKVLLERLLGSIFSIDGLVDQYVFQKISYKNFLGVILLPINGLLLFTLSPTTQVIYGFIGLLVLVNLIGLITSFKRHQNLIKNNLFYFILYLCALEIAPYLFLYKVLASK
ncbi:hypothetical protein JCM19300_3786 [Algibacter lectus]|uniref:Uncharacterized protein DUF4271 n=2 Tax=Algibacter lectus TaxID=221126 RepID=A0A090V9J6_9FLAO|nr:uncharacterized protein DUF4271 [Algibacter lectus]GAL60848.1 hypothetical protein JCM19300_3786 [Algibacter lectus]GAL78738.1 hypothetical protein JCM19274_3296 [Algibacter lectus]SFC75529.1 protein of unknown function [Algibacter lectus]